MQPLSLLRRRSEAAKLSALLHRHPYAVRAVFAPRFGDDEPAVSCYSSLLSLCKPALLLGLKVLWLIRAVACLFGPRFPHGNPYPVPIHQEVQKIEPAVK